EQPSPHQEYRDRLQRSAAETERDQVEHPGSRGRDQAGDHATLRSAAISVVTRPWPRDQRGRELTAGDEADDECAKTQSTVHVERKHGHRRADDEESDKD